MLDETREQAPVLVVGAGTAGLAAAIGLSDRGLPPIVVERQPGGGTHPRATALTGTTMRQIRAWGVEAPVRDRGFDSQHAMSIRASLTGPEYHRIPFVDHEWTCAQDHLEAILADRARTASAALRYGTELVDLTPLSHGVLATVVTPGGDRHQIHALYVVGADGAHSTVRSIAGITTTNARSFGDWISILFRSPLREHLDAPPFMVYNIVDPAPAGVFVPTDATDRWIRGIPFYPDRGEHRQDFNVHRCVSVIRAGAGVADLPVHILDVRAFRMNAAHADHYHSGRAVLVGDAAHTFTPTSGMGLNLALHDGTEAARILADIIDDDQPETALKQYEQLCRPPASALLEPELNSDPQATR